jgi:hypothetical protein
MKMSPEEFVQWMEAQRRDLVKYQPPSPAPAPEMRNQLMCDPPFDNNAEDKVAKEVAGNIVAWAILAAIVGAFLVTCGPSIGNALYLGTGVAAIVCFTFPVIAVVGFFCLLLLFIFLIAWATQR